MKLIGARFYGGIDDRAVAAAELRTVGVGLNFELFQSFHRRLNHVVGFIQQIGKVGIVVHTIKQKVVLKRAGAIR